MEETPKSLIEGFIQTAQTHHTEVPKRQRHALTRTPDQMPSPGVGTRSATKRKRFDLPDKTPRSMIETYMTNANTELLSTSRTRRRRSFPAAPVNVTADTFTPRTNIAMLMEQGVEETPYVRPQKTRRSSRMSLPSLPASDSIQLLPMSPSIDEEHSRRNSTLGRSRRSKADPTQGNTTTESARKRKSTQRRSSTGPVTNPVLDDIPNSIHLMPDSSSDDETMETDESRKRSPITNSQRPNIASSSQMFNFKEDLSTYEGTEEEQDDIHTDGNLSVIVLAPSSLERSSNSSPVRIPETQEIQDSQNNSPAHHRSHHSSLFIAETQEDSMAGGRDTQESSPVRPHPSSQSGAEADNESEEDVESRSRLQPGHRTSTGNVSRLLPGDRTSTGKDVSMGSWRSSLSGDRTSTGNVSTNAVDIAGSDRNRSRQTTIPEMISSVKHFDTTEQEHNNSIFDKSTSLAGIEDDTDTAHPSTATTAGDEQGGDKETSVQEMEEVEGQDLVDREDMEADFMLDEESTQSEDPVDEDEHVEDQSEDELEETEEVTENVTEDFRLAHTPYLATPLDSQRPTVRPLTDVLKNRTAALPLQSVNEVLRDRGNTTLGNKKDQKTSQRKPRAKSQLTAPLPVSVIKKVFSHYCQMKVSSDILPGLINVTEKFFRQVPADLEAFCHHAGRKTIDETDVELLMRRQRLIKDSNSLNVLIEENLPLEYRQQLIAIARSGNIVYPK